MGNRDNRAAAADKGSRTDKAAGMLSIVMPAYNEEKLIYKSLTETLTICENFVDRLEIIAVNDGSRDRTKEEIIRACEYDSRIKMVSSDNNHGKGAAILYGVTEAEGDYIAFVDADLELPPVQLEAYLKRLIADKLDAVIGCKLHKDSKIKYPLKRKIISVGYYLMLLVMFHLNVKDTQTGLKVFKASSLRPIAHLVRTQGYAYDIELLVALHRRGGKIGEMPVEVCFVRPKDSKRIGMKDVIKVFKDTWAIFGRLYFKHYYDEK
jgi:glycosyltransferase involved in cell wall biosynthesis